ncbi:general substrate transporter [Phaeosphaeriaceae sp. PMI808]|nr:general substrate transporter [Phaeosphaeriaceae sp. PMI808]
MAKFLGLRGSGLTSAISAICGLCFLCYGYAQGVVGGLLTVPTFLEQFPQVDIVSDSSFHSAWLTGLTVGAWHLGCLVSAFLAIFISDYFGRRRTLLLGITLWAVGEIVQTSSYSFSQFLLGRVIAGFGNGFTTSTAPAYQAECIKSHRKGTAVFAFSYVSSTSAAWRIPIALQITFSVPPIIMLFFLPDSPRWLILTRWEQEALAVIAALNDANSNDFEVRDEFLQIKDATLVMTQGSTSELLSNEERRGFHRVLLAFFVQVFQQGSGINLVLQYLSWIFLNRIGYSAWLARLLASCSATAYFVASLVTVIGIDRFWGRRSLMMFGASGMSGCMALITVTQYLWIMYGVSAGRVLSTAFLFGFSIFFAIGWQGMAWLYQVEIVPLRIRGPAAALSTCGNWLLNFLVVFITPIAFNDIGYRTWIIFGATNLAIISLIYIFFPETAFRSLEEVDVIFFLADQAPGNSWLNAVRISLHEPLWFGRKGENKLILNYANSSWHHRLMSSTKNGTRSRSNNEKRGRACEKKV